MHSEESFVVEEAVAISTSPLLVFAGQYRGHLMIVYALPWDISILRQGVLLKEYPHCKTAISLSKVNR